MSLVVLRHSLSCACFWRVRDTPAVLVADPAEHYLLGVISSRQEAARHRPMRNTTARAEKNLAFRNAGISRCLATPDPSDQNLSTRGWPQIETAHTAGDGRPERQSTGHRRRRCAVLHGCAPARPDRLQYQRRPPSPIQIDLPHHTSPPWPISVPVLAPVGRRWSPPPLLHARVEKRSGRPIGDDGKKHQRGPEACSWPPGHSIAGRIVLVPRQPHRQQGPGWPGESGSTPGGHALANLTSFKAPPP